MSLPDLEQRAGATGASRRASRGDAPTASGGAGARTRPADAPAHHPRGRTGAVLRMALCLTGAAAVAIALSAATPAAPVSADGGDLYLPLALSGISVDRLPTPRPPTATQRATAAATATEPPTATEGPTATPTDLPTATPTPTPTGYREPLPDFTVGLDDLREAYTPARAYETILAILERRYPTGYYIVTHLDDSRTNALRWAGSGTSGWNSLLQRLELVVHEMNHQLGIQEGWLPSGAATYVYVVRDDMQVSVTNHKTFARSEIARYVTGPLENMYKSTYLTGTSGSQGFTNLLDELNAYTHSLFTAYGTHDEFSPGRRASHRDGLVTFMMYTQFYLRHARERHTADYDLLHDDPEMRALVKLLWERANFILDTTEPITNLSMDPAAIEAEMRKDEMQAEIARFVRP